MDLSSDTIESRRKGHISSSKNLSTKKSIFTENIFSNKGELRAFRKEEKLRVFVTGIHTLKE